jgi:hypothetical protein
MIVWLHQKYVIWACEKYINETDFGKEDADMDEQQVIIGNIPVHIAREWTGIGTMQQRKDAIAMNENFDFLASAPINNMTETVKVFDEEKRPVEFWRMDAVNRRVPGYRKLIKAPPVEKEESEEDS